MSNYRKTGSIDSFNEIPWDKPVIVSGGIGNNAWMWRMPGTFERNDGEPRFRDEYGMSKYVDKNTRISLNVLEVDNG